MGEEERGGNERGKFGSFSPCRQRADIPLTTNHIYANKTRSKLNHSEKKHRRLNYKVIGLRCFQRNENFSTRQFLQRWWPCQILRFRSSTN